MSELKPCPFCGGEAKIKARYYRAIDCFDYSGVCKECNASMDVKDTRAEAIEAWNTRAAELYRFPENKRAARVELDEQIHKLFEEVLEVMVAYRDGEPAHRLIEELWDVIQAAEGCLRKFAKNAVSDGFRFVLAKSRERGDYGRVDG